MDIFPPFHTFYDKIEIILSRKPGIYVRKKEEKRKKGKRKKKKEEIRKQRPNNNNLKKEEKSIKAMTLFF